MKYLHFFCPAAESSYLTNFGVNGEQNCILKTTEEKCELTVPDQVVYFITANVNITGIGQEGGPSRSASIAQVFGKRGTKWLVAWLPRREDDSSSNQQVSKQPTWPAWVSSQIYSHHLQPSPQACHRLGISLVILHILDSQLGDLDVHEWTKDARRKGKATMTVGSHLEI